MVLDGSALEAVKGHFPHGLEVSHLWNARQGPRLPADQPDRECIREAHEYGLHGPRAEESLARARAAVTSR